MQYYHRQVTLLLVTGAPLGRQPLRMPLDHEVQRPGEGEVATAVRLLERVLVRYPRLTLPIWLESCLNGPNKHVRLCDRRARPVRVALPRGDRRLDVL